MSAIATKIQSIIENYTAQGLDKYETRLSTEGTLDCFGYDTTLIDRGAGIITSKEKSNIEDTGYATNLPKIAVINRKDVTVTLGGITTCDAVETPADTALYSVVPVDISTDLQVPLDEYDYNHVDFGSAWAREMMSRVKSIKSALNVAGLAALDAARNQQQTPDNLMSFFVDSLTNEFNVPTADKGLMYSHIPNQMEIMAYQGPFNVIGNPSHFAKTLGPQMAQGTGNATNQQWQQTGEPIVPVQNTSPFEPLRYFKDANLANNVGVLETSYVIPEGSLALVNSVNTPKYSRTLKSGTELGITSLPGLDPSYQFGFRAKDECVAGNDISHLQMEARFFFIVPYNSNIAAYNSPINKYQVV